VPGDAALGALLRELRTSHRLTLAAVARRIGCAESLISLVETGRRPLQPWLAERLDDLYDMGGTIVALLNAGVRACRGGPLVDDVLLVRIPSGGVTVSLSRRALLAALGVGAVHGPPFRALADALGDLSPAVETVDYLEHTLDGLQTAARFVAPLKTIDPLTSQVALVDVLRQRAEPQERRRLAVLQIRCAESLSWMHEEAADVHNALYWIDRAVQWAQTTQWTSMVSYGFVRRSMLALSYADDGARAVEHARAALRIPAASPWIKGLAAKQVAFGLAVMQRPGECARALDSAMSFFADKQDDDEGRGLGQRSVASDDLFAIFKATCDVYGHRGELAIPVLQPRLAGLSRASLRTHAITSAKLVHAYACAGEPERACSLLHDTADRAQSVGSLSAARELRRALPALAYWSSRSDIRDARERLRSLP
jgi:hypothetical protein